MIHTALCHKVFPDNRWDDHCMFQPFLWSRFWLPYHYQIFHMLLHHNCRFYSCNYEFLWIAMGYISLVSCRWKNRYWNSSLLGLDGWQHIHNWHWHWHFWILCDLQAHWLLLILSNLYVTDTLNVKDNAKCNVSLIINIAYSQMILIQFADQISGHFRPPFTNSNPSVDK